MLIYKILTAEQWRDLQAKGQTQGAPIDIADGFIYFSTADQAGETAAKYFADVQGLVLLAYDTDTLGDALIWEVSRGGALFPHLFAPLKLSQMAWARPLPVMDTAHIFPEEAAGHVDPTRAQFDTFKALDRDHPIEMLNLIRLRTDAAYPAGHVLAEQALTGRDAYANYGHDTAPIFTRLGGEIIWRGQFQSVLVGPDSEHWDHAFIARYPSTHAFLEMVTDPSYQQAIVHRQAAVRTSRLIRCAPNDTGTTFG